VKGRLKSEREIVVPESPAARTKTIHLAFFDAGGGHRSAAMALKQVAEAQNRQWDIRLLNMQELMDPIDVVRRITGMRTQDVYNAALKRGYTLGWGPLTRVMQAVIRVFHEQQLQLLEKYWSQVSADLVVSLIPHFNRALYQSLGVSHPNTPFMTVLTDFADFPPNFWMERQPQYLVCGTDKAAQQARARGYPAERILRSSGMVLSPKFYDEMPVNRAAERKRLGLDPDLPTGLVLFGGHGSVEMETVAQRAGRAHKKIQLIFLCGHNEALKRRLQGIDNGVRMHIQGFTRDVPYYMRLADFFIGKPGPGSLSEALAMRLPVIVARNAWTLPQERYNTDWIQEQGVGIVVPSLRSISKAIDRLLEPAKFKNARKKIEAYQNEAVFEIPEMMEKLMRESSEKKVGVVQKRT